MGRWHREPSEQGTREGTARGGQAPPSTLLAVRNGPCARADALTNTPRRACSSGGAGHGQTGGGRSGVTRGSGPCGSRDFEGPSAPHRFSVRPTLEPTFTWLLTHGLCRRGRWPEAGGTCRAGRGPQGLTACRQRCPQCTPGSVPASRRVPTAPLPSAGTWGSSSGHVGARPASGAQAAARSGSSLAVRLLRAAQRSAWGWPRRGRPTRGTVLSQVGRAPWAWEPRAEAGAPGRTQAAGVQPGDAPSVIRTASHLQVAKWNLQLLFGNIPICTS